MLVTRGFKFVAGKTYQLILLFQYVIFFHMLGVMNSTEEESHFYPKLVMNNYFILLFFVKVGGLLTPCVLQGLG